MCYKSDEKFMIKYFIIYLKTRLSSQDIVRSQIAAQTQKNWGINPISPIQ